MTVCDPLGSVQGLISLFQIMTVRDPLCSALGPTLLFFNHDGA